ncbi:uncharacterized protein LOC144472062 isoform X1 [Augochlora pura]
MNLPTIQRCIQLLCKSNINLGTYRKITTLTSYNLTLTKPSSLIRLYLQHNCNNFLHSSSVQYEKSKCDIKIINNRGDVNYSALQLKKRPKKRPFPKNEEVGEWNVKALATAEEYDLESLVHGLMEENLYIPDTICTSTSYTNCSTTDTNNISIPYCTWKQVEINTIASGFGWLGPASTKLHKYVLTELGCHEKVENLPENNALQIICSSMIEAWNMYNDKRAVILFVIEDVPYNICDQCFHEYEINKRNPNIKVIRRNLTQLAATTKLGSSKELIVDHFIVAVVYYRCGYKPEQYHSRKEWEVRLLIERSLAIKCPTIQYHLVGTKKIQQVLAKPGVINKFLNNEKLCAEIKEIFTEHYSLDFNEHGNAAIEMGIADPHRFVLKPQREGGCNNKYGLDIKYFLESVKYKQDRVAWVLMDKIYPPVHKNYMIRPEINAIIKPQELVSELGIFALPDVIHATAKYEIELEPREIFFFREGTVVMWNVTDLEYGNILKFLKNYEENPYTDVIIEAERELMTYAYTDSGKQSHIKNGNIMLALAATNLDKYTFSNAIAQSVKLGIWETSLDNYIDSIELVTEDLKFGRKLRISQQEVLKKQGELFALRHSINLSSDLLDTPDFYWERDDLEILYQHTCSYFNITKRTRVINEKINHCVELVGILSSHLSDRHHIRLEWMIIILIMVEVGFETIHYIDRYLT